MAIKGNICRVRSGYGGSKSKDYECDAIVMCNGWQTSTMLTKLLNHSVPIIPLKQYSVVFRSEV